MKIMVDLRSLMETGGKISGVENYLLNVLPFIHSEENSFSGFYNSFKDVYMPEFKKDFNVTRRSIPNKILNTTLSFFSFPKFEKLFGSFDILWLPDLRPFAISKTTKLAITAHDLSPVMHPEYYSLKRRIWHWLIQHKRSFKKADLVFAISEYTKNDLISFGVSEKKIKVVKHGLNHELFNTDISVEQKQEVRNKYKLPGKFLLSISTVEPRKNIEGLIKGFEMVDDPDLFLVIAGRLGWLYKGVLELANRSNKKEQIIFTGYVDEKDKPALISSAHIVCYPSFYEGFGFVPLEAMACGVPVITSARTSMAEICGDSALLIEPYQLPELVNAIKALNTDDVLRAHFTEKGLEHVKGFTWEKSALEIQRGLIQLAQTKV